MSGRREVTVSKTCGRSMLMLSPVDGTLSILTNAARSRGLCHKVIRNLALQADTSLDLHHNLVSARRSWNPQLQASDVLYQTPLPRTKCYRLCQEQHRWKTIKAEALNAFGEVVRMAEATSSVTLGRVIPR